MKKETIKNVSLLAMAWIIAIQLAYIWKLESLCDYAVSSVSAATIQLKEDDSTMDSITKSLRECNSSSATMEKIVERDKARIKLLTSDLIECTPQPRGKDKGYGAENIITE